ncbi:23S rRNA pseudouridine2605 synthase [Gemmobacter aquatilis]|uniref:Pseudouridine synthase n=1 Tax=Gemmobacter aquatilis TaxID=933059 RepID=A0A1H8E3I0_9RHOB|nr:pseudouridine synthase [Gemmobacter aquatilis]SEN14032.1 23S rRNA pseudouridine2605 synthase [Gemmobacter aquatilis]
MTEQAKPKAATPEGERIAKVLSRAGVASRREAERMIELGEVSVNGKVISSPALNVTPQDRITINGKPLAEKEPARLWLYYKPEGLVTSASDEKGRDTVFDHLPEDLPRVMSIGRLDLNSEGLLLLTNDGGLKRQLELPSTGWLRKYRVRIHGNPTDVDLEPLRKGIEVDGERFQPMIVILDRVQGSNAWLTVGLREGRNREIRRAIAAIGLVVNRLIRVSYGPFRLGDLAEGEVQEVKGRVLRDQLGFDPDGDEAPEPRKAGAKPGRTRGPRGGGGAGAEAPRGAAAGPRRVAKPVADEGAARPARAGIGAVRRGAKPAGEAEGAGPARARPAKAGAARAGAALAGSAKTYLDAVPRKGAGAPAAKGPRPASGGPRGKGPAPSGRPRKG